MVAAKHLLQKLNNGGKAFPRWSKWRYGRTNCWRHTISAHIGTNMNRRHVKERIATGEEVRWGRHQGGSGVRRRRRPSLSPYLEQPIRRGPPGPPAEDAYPRGRRWRWNAGVPAATNATTRTAGVPPHEQSQEDVPSRPAVTPEEQHQEGMTTDPGEGQHAANCHRSFNTLKSSIGEPQHHLIAL